MARVLLTVSLLVSALVACSDSTTAPNGVLRRSMSVSSTAPLRRYALVSQHAVNLALTPPYDTVQLTGVPINRGMIEGTPAAGTPLTGFGPVAYTAADSAVSVSQTGLVIAHYETPPGFPTQVIVQQQAQGVTLTDTVFIQVTPTPLASPLATLSLQPAAGDSAKRSVDFGVGFALGFPWPATVTNQAGNTVCNGSGCPVLVSYHSSDSGVATIDRLTGQVTPHTPGHVVFTATTLAYGVALHDSVAFTVGYPLQQTINITLVLLLGVLTATFAGAPKKLIMGVGAVVTFCTQTTQPVDVVFNHPAAVDTASCQIRYGVAFGSPTGSGNIPAFGGVYQVDANGDTTYRGLADLANCASRRFTAPGTYHYHSSLFPSDTFTIEIRKE